MQKVLTAALLLASTSAIKLKVKHDDVREIMDQYDLDKDGLISKDEALEATLFEGVKDLVHDLREMDEVYEETDQN